MTQTHVGKTCPFCMTPLKPQVEVVVCPTCGMPHHEECWRENGGCTTFGCRGQVVAPPTAPPPPPAQPATTAPMPAWFPRTATAPLPYRICCAIVEPLGVFWIILGWLFFLAALIFPVLYSLPLRWQVIPLLALSLLVLWWIIDAIAQEVNLLVLFGFGVMLWLSGYIFLFSFPLKIIAWLTYLSKVRE